MATADDGGSASPTAASTDLADVTRDMLMLHRVFRRELGAAPALVRSVADGDTARAAAVAAHLRLVLKILDVHHSGEDELVWPLLMQRAPTDEQLIATMEAQHAVVAKQLPVVERRLLSWIASGSTDDGTALAAELTTLQAALVEHLDLEEAKVLTLIAAHLSPPEWDRLAQHGMRAVGDDERVPVLGMFMEDMPDAERAAFLGHMPPPVSQMWSGIGQASYGAYVAEVRGTS
jgi:hemerythrin-like domain-containing protein